MIMNPLNSIAEEPGKIFWFLAGVLSVQVWQWIKCKWKDRHDPQGAPHKMKKLNTYWLAVVVVLTSIAAVSLQNYKTYTFAEQLAKDTRDCQLEFNQALRVRSQITVENDTWSQIQRKALADWLHDLIFPPPYIGTLPPEHPDRQSWVLIRTAQADTVIREAQEEQDKNIRERPPYPDPTCGK